MKSEREEKRTTEEKETGDREEVQEEEVLESSDEEGIEDDLLDVMLSDVTDFSDESPKTDKDVSHHTTLKEILETDEFMQFDFEEKDQVESHISNSIAGDIFNEEIGAGESVQSEYKEQEKEGEGFIEMIEGLGFDRRSVLYTEKTKDSGDVPFFRSQLNKDEFLDSGMWFYQKGQYNKAIEEFRKAIEIDPNYIEVYQCLGDAFFRMGQLDNAMQAYEKVRQLDPDNLNVLENLGVIFANRGDYKKAVWQWGEVLKKNPERKDIINRIKRMQRVIRQRSL